MKKLISFILIFAFPFSFVHSDWEETLDERDVSSYQFIIDRHLSPYAAGEDLLMVHRSLEKLDEMMLPLSEKKGLFAQIARASELLFAWMPINYTTSVVQHEVFGHGYRIRDLGREVARVKKYKFLAPPPYGPGGGATYYNLNPETTTPYQMAAICIGGVEATAILANRLKLHWLDRSSLPAQESLLYLFSHHDISIYISSLSSDDAFDEGEGHDIKRYLKFLHLAYPKGSLSKAELKRMARINFFDPFTYLSLSSWFTYVTSGTTNDIPMFKFKSLSYLPSSRLGLTPFGPEYYLENYIKYKEVPTYVYLKRGHFARNTYLGIGFENDRLFEHKAHSLGLRLDLWRQPKLLSYATMSLPGYASSMRPLHTHHFGGATQLIYNYALTPEHFALHCQLGYKTDGYLPGESLKRGVLAKFAFSAKF